MPDAPVKIGFVGGGMIAQVGHLPFYLRDSRCEVCRIAESRPSLVDALTRQFGVKHVVKDHRAVIEDPDIQAIVISAPRAATGPLTLEALEAGKHVMAEKPMAHSVEQAQKLVATAAHRRLVYAVGFMKRYDPGVQAAKVLVDEVVADGRLGRMLLARLYDFASAYAVAPPPHVRPMESRTKRFATWPLYPEWLPERHRSAYPWFVNMAGHDINLLRLFFPQDVEVMGAHCDRASSVVAALRNGRVNIVLEVTRSTAGRWIEGIEFLFEHGQIRVLIPSPMATDKVSEVWIDDERGGLVNRQMTAATGWSFERQARGFVDALTGAAAPATSGEEGLADMVLTEQIWRRMTG